MKYNQVKAILIDLDHTIWKFNSWDGKTRTKQDVELGLFPEVKECIECLKVKYDLFITSASSVRDLCERYINDVFPEDTFRDMIIKPTYPTKVPHVDLIREKYGYWNYEMLLIDDLMCFINSVNKIKCKTIHVKNGLTMDLIKDLL